MSDTLTKPKVDIDQDLKNAVKYTESLEKQVVVHCRILNSHESPMGVRIWPTTFLLDNDSAHRSILLHQENIPLMPNWKEVQANGMHKFTLIFAGLPKSCSTFHMVEVIPQKGGFEVTDIARNKLDVYHVEIS